MNTEGAGLVGSVIHSIYPFNHKLILKSPNTISQTLSVFYDVTGSCSLHEPSTTVGTVMTQISQTKNNALSIHEIHFFSF